MYLKGSAGIAVYRYTGIPVFEVSCSALTYECFCRDTGIYMFEIARVS